MSWPESRLAEVLQVKHGFAFKGEFFTNHGDVVVVTPGNFFDEGGFKSKGNNEKFYNGPVPDGYILEPGSLIVAMTEQAEGLLGSAAKTPVGRVYLHNQRLGLISTIRADSLDLQFAYYLFNSRPVRQQIRASSSGTKVRHTSPSRIGDVRVKLPPVAVQRCIADILSAYDDLIENNTRRIAILEDMARRLFEEWFARASDDERLANWAIATVGGASAYINRGIAPKYDDAAEALVINQKCVRAQRLSLALARRQSKSVPNDKIVRPGDILINSTGVGTLGRVAQVFEVPDRTTIDTHVTIVRPGPGIDHHWFGLALLRLQSYFEDAGVGSTGQTELSRSRISEAELLIPDLGTMEQFGNLVGPIRLQTYALEQANTNLRATRDLLLPKLISGEIEVRAAEEALEAAAA